jgi:Protein of unknown function (DUF2911)
MKFRPRVPAVLAALVVATSAALIPVAHAAPAGGGFVVLLGSDTVSVERYTRTPKQVVVDQVGRSPRVMRRHFVYDYSGTAITHFSMVVTPAGGTAATQTVDAIGGADSLTVTTTTGDNPPRVTSAPVPRGGLVSPLSSPWTGYETLVMSLLGGKADSIHVAQWYLGNTSTQGFAVHRLGRDSVAISNEVGTLFHAKVDRTGRILGMLPIAGTGKFTVIRNDRVDLDAMAASFLARETAGGAMGALSPRDTVRADNAGGAAIWIDYGRPGKRGRTIFPDVVPYGEVWRTGANAATQIKTDKALDFNGTVVPAGFYTLWAIPSEQGWKLLVNSETGQWGTEHKPERDVFTISMTTSRLSQEVERFTIAIEPNDRGGTLNMDWDTTRASVGFTVVP